MLFLNMLKDLIFRVLLSEELKQHIPFDLDIAKEDETLPEIRDKMAHALAQYTINGAEIV